MKFKYGKHFLVYFLITPVHQEKHTMEKYIQVIQEMFLRVDMESKITDVTEDSVESSTAKKKKPHLGE